MRIPVVASLALAAALVGCSPPTETFLVVGTVVSADAATGVARVDHEEITGLMPAMTMDFDVEPDSLLDDVRPGDRIRFRLKRSGSLLQITAIEVIGHERPQTSRGPIDADDAPDFELVDQDGERFALRDQRGRVVLLDFVFTRCPGPCPILTSTHVTLQKKIPDELADRVHFVSVSIDPEFDTPSRMRAYAEARGADLGTWSFLTGDPDAVEAVVKSYRVGTLRRDDGTIDHFVVTFLIDGDGHIAERYTGLEVPPERILGDLRALLSRDAGNA